MDHKLSIKTQDVEQYQDELTTTNSELDLLLKHVSEGNAHHKISDLGVVLDTNSDQSVRVKLNDGSTFNAKKAVSCIHLLNVGDLVLLEGYADRLYVIALLETSKNQVELVSDTMNFKAKDVHIDVNAMQIKSTSFNLDATRQTINSVKYQLNAIDLSFSSQRMNNITKVSKSSCEVSERFVSEMDRVHALNINYSAEMFARIEAHTTVINGEELLKTDAKLIISG
jgi:hypothetical protein